MNSFFWWTGLISLILFLPIGFIVVFGIALDWAMNKYPPMWKVMYRAAVLMREERQAK